MGKSIGRMLVVPPILVLFMPITRRNGNAYYNFQHSNLRASSKMSSMHFHQPCTLYRIRFPTIPILCFLLFTSFYQIKLDLSSCLFNSQRLTRIDCITCCIVPFQQLRDGNTIYTRDRIKSVARLHSIASGNRFLLRSFFYSL